MIGERSVPLRQNLPCLLETVSRKDVLGVSTKQLTELLSGGRPHLKPAAELDIVGTTYHMILVLKAQKVTEAS